MIEFYSQKFSFGRALFALPVVTRPVRVLVKLN